MAQADGAAGNAVQAYLDSVGAQLAMQIQAMPPGQRHALTRRVPLGGQYAADVTVTGDAGDLRSLAGFGYTVVDTDPDRTRLVALAQGQVADAAGARAAGNELLAVLDEAQARVDVAYAGLPAGARTDKMLGVTQQFVDAGRGTAAAGNWNLVQTFETAADVSLRIAAQPEGSRTALTERFMHEKVKHDITVDPNSADPFATFKDHSKGQDALGAIVQGVVGVAINLATLIPGSQGFTVPLAVAWDAGQAGKNFADGNVFGGVLSLGAAAGGGLRGWTRWRRRAACRGRAALPRTRARWRTASRARSASRTRRRRRPRRPSAQRRRRAMSARRCWKARRCWAACRGWRRVRRTATRWASRPACWKRRLRWRAGW